MAQSQGRKEYCYANYDSCNDLFKTTNAANAFAFRPVFIAEDLR